jgi:long-chain fatty acid transport protein
LNEGANPRGRLSYHGRRMRATGPIAVAIAALGAAAGAQEPVRSFDYVLSNPGARSVALGGAFAGLADDATAAFGNPAGLVQLLRPEVSAELRLASRTLDGDSGSDPVAEASGLGFASFVWPGRGWSAAVYLHRAASYEFASVDPEVVVADGTGVDMLSVGAAAAIRLHERLSLGFGGSYFVADLGADGSLSQDDSSWGYNAGLLWRPLDSLRLGAFYREGPELEIHVADDPPSVRWVSTPDVAGAGVAYQPGDGSLTLAFEVDRLIYPSVTSTFQLAEGSDEDATQIHLGGEYAFLGWDPVTAFRGGFWLDRGRVGGGAGPDAGSDEDIPHGALGFGLAWTRFQLDVGLDFAEDEATLSASVIWSF